MMENCPPKDGTQHGLQHRDLGLEPARKLDTSKSLTSKSKSSGVTRRTGLSLASLASGVSYSSIVRRLPPYISEGLLRTIFEDKTPEDKGIK